MTFDIDWALNNNYLSIVIGEVTSVAVASWSASLNDFTGVIYRRATGEKTSVIVASRGQPF